MDRHASRAVVGSEVVTTRPVVIVVAAARDGVIGREGALPWRQKTDLRRFRDITIGKPLIMGRKTFASIGRALPGRETIVLTRDPDFSAAGVHVAGTLAEALALAERLGESMGATEIVVAGGAEVYAQTLPHASRIELTQIEAAPDGDARFPALDALAWVEIARSEHSAGPEDDHAFAFVTLARRDQSPLSPRPR